MAPKADPESSDKITRQLFRRFSELLNDRIRKLDTSVLNKTELFAIYQRSLGGRQEGAIQQIALSSIS